jgi:hypothetical protein
MEKAVACFCNKNLIIKSNPLKHAKILVIRLEKFGKTEKKNVKKINFLQESKIFRKFWNNLVRKHIV